MEEYQTVRFVAIPIWIVLPIVALAAWGLWKVVMWVLTFTR